MSKPFEGSAVTRVRVPKTSELVADQIRSQVVRGELGEGDYLPPEGQMMETLAVSRPTLREALRILESEGLIRVVRGSRSGAQVFKPSVDLVSRYAGYVLQSQGTTIADLYQARLAIEPTVVRWLATDGPDQPGFAIVRSALADLTRLYDEDRYEDFIDSVADFHQTLVVATNNKTLIFVNRMLLNLQRTHQNSFQRRRERTHEEKMKSIRTGLRSYRKLVTLIEAQAVEDAVAHWRLHLRNANETWAGADEGDRIVDSLSESRTQA